MSETRKGNVSDCAISVPLVRSTNRHPSSQLCASFGMALAYARNNRFGERYRDLLELCLHDHPVSFATAVAVARRLFPDVPMSHYGPDEMAVDDAVLLARVAAERCGRVLPVIAFAATSVVLSNFSLDDVGSGAFFYPEPPRVGRRRLTRRVRAIPEGFECALFGWLPPALADPISWSPRWSSPDR